VQTKLSAIHSGLIERQDIIAHQATYSEIKKLKGSRTYKNIQHISKGIFTNFAYKDC
jgi:hypothetical protein